MTEHTKVQKLVDRISKQIADGTLHIGDRLPSIRSAAATLGVAKNTVTEAYLRLSSLGVIEARSGSGFRVSRRSAVRVRKQPDNSIVEALDMVSLLREQLERHYDVNPGDARPPPEWLQVDINTRSPRGSHRNRIESTKLSQWGYRPLREWLSLSLSNRGIVATPEQILLTGGGNHALDLIVRHFVRPGDRVLVDDPGFYPLFGKLKLAGAEIIGVKRTAAGPDLESLAAGAAAGPKLFFTQSLAHNPTGGDLTLGTAYATLQMAERHDIRIVETDTFADVLPPTAPRLAALDQLHRVIYIGTFTKTFSANLRVGYLAAPPADASALADLKLITITATSDYTESVMHDLLESGRYLRHMRRLREHLDQAQDKARLNYSAFGVTLPEISGLYFWLQLPDWIDEAELAHKASAESIFIAPGRVFAAGRDKRPPATRINLAHASHPAFLEFLRRHVFNR